MQPSAQTKHEQIKHMYAYVYIPDRRVHEVDVAVVDRTRREVRAARRDRRRLDIARVLQQSHDAYEGECL